MSKTSTGGFATESKETADGETGGFETKSKGTDEKGAIGGPAVKPKRHQTRHRETLALR